MDKFLRRSFIVGVASASLGFIYADTTMAYSGAAFGRKSPEPVAQDVTTCTDPHTGKKVRCVTAPGAAKVVTGPPIPMTANPQTASSVSNLQGPFTLMPFITVSTTPYIGEISAFDASDVLNQAGKINEDLLLLQTRQQMVADLDAANLQLTRPIIELSGGLEGQMVENTGYEHGSGSINLSTAEFDIHGFASSWASGFMAFNFDSSPGVTGTRTPNSRIFLSRGFVNIGNLDVTPIYFTIGQMYLPFGRYASDMITTPVTQSLARTDDRAAVVGYYHNGFNASIYSYTGDATTGSNFVFKQGGFNTSYKHAFNDITTLNVGGGIISNLTDSDGLQNTRRGSSDQFSGFATPTGSNAITHNVPAADIHSEFAYGPWNANGEFISAIEEASVNDLTFNGDGALPQAMHVEVERKFPLKDLVLHALIAYDHTWDALAANLPEQSITASVNTAIWKNTVEALEFRHDIDYSDDDTATGSQKNRPDDETIFGTGKSRNIILLQVGVYF